MNNDKTINADACYQIAEQRAAQYFEALKQQVMQKDYVSILIKDIQAWKHNHINKNFVQYFMNRNMKPDAKEYQDYVKWMDYTGKLDNYLERSISYIFMRDLGKRLDSTDTQTEVRRAVDRLKKQLTDSSRKNLGNKAETLSMTKLYRSAQKEGIESTVIWLMNKLKTVSSNIPTQMDRDQSQRKLIKIIAGVVMHEVEAMSVDISSEDRMQKLNQAIRLGYAYGLTYPFIDDLLDAKILSDKETEQYSDLIRTTLITGDVPELGEWTENNAELIRYIHSELREAFEYIKAQQRPETIKSFFEQAYVFFNSQEQDRIKDLTNPNYTNEQLYIPIILKSSSSRLIVRSVISASEDKEFDNLTFFYGIYNQLADDFTDMFDDMEAGAVTPYTYYMKYHDKRSDLINPFELYWTVISNLIHNVYNSHPKSCEVILSRVINSLKRYKERMGIEKYDEVMALFASRNPELNSIIQQMVVKAVDVDFFDKLLRDHMISTLKNERKEQQDFLDIIKDARQQINSSLNIAKDNSISLMKDTITEAANYSLQGDGKRLRPIMAWVMGVNAYGLSSSSIVPLVRSLEYMHTASLIFDDLPSQDNALTRRGSSTLHQVYNISTAELTGLFLTQKAIEEQISLDMFDSKTVLKLLRYTTQTTQSMCKGQAMDLDSKGKCLTLEQLNSMCFYKTGIAFEASLVMPAILANAKELEIEALKKFAYNAGIAFQIKDDILDVEGDESLLGKTIGKDTQNNSSTFVSVLGIERAKIEMWEHYCLAMEVLKEVPKGTDFLKHLLNYVVNRDH
jgi:geranylgeranyl pyrophosphate synthase